MKVAYRTELGVCFQGMAEEVLTADESQKYAHQIDLIFTSPPFPLNTKKRYGNLQGDEYIRWLEGFAEIFRGLLAPRGSIVIELGNAWEPGKPVMSTLALETLLAFRRAGHFELCQQFIYYNPARLPSPAQWVNVDRIRVKDSFTHLWWMALTDRPKADNKRVLKQYSTQMQELLRTGKYNAGTRPSEHRVGTKSFLKDNNGAIPSNVITASNTQSNTEYLEFCRANNLPLHPARMPLEVAEFFIKFLTEPGDLVLDPFAGSNTTGEAADKLGRRWIAIETNPHYVQGSQARFGLWAKSTDEDKTSEARVVE